MQSGCSVYWAATQPGPANLSGLGVGSSRDEVIGKLGVPKLTEIDPEGKKEDMFEFQSGLHQATKARVIFYVAADLFTVALAELILWPAEMTLLDEATCIARATYDQSQKVVKWQVTQRSGFQGC